MDAHGTNGAYQQHLKNGTEPCAECRAARAAHQRRWRHKMGKGAQMDALRTRAARAATAELVRRHRDEFKALCQEYLEELVGA